MAFWAVYGQYIVSCFGMALVGIVYAVLPTRKPLGYRLAADKRLVGAVLSSTPCPAMCTDGGIGGPGGDVVAHSAASCCIAQCQWHAVSEQLFLKYFCGVLPYGYCGIAHLRHRRNRRRTCRLYLSRTRRAHKVLLAHSALCAFSPTCLYGRICMGWGIGRAGDELIVVCIPFRA